MNLVPAWPIFVLGNFSSKFAAFVKNLNCPEQHSAQRGKTGKHIMVVRAQARTTGNFSSSSNGDGCVSSTCICVEFKKIDTFKQHRAILLTACAFHAIFPMLPVFLLLNEFSDSLIFTVCRCSTNGRFEE
jgi:hypothetical protein